MFTSRRLFHPLRMPARSLPRLPVPELRHTLDRYLASLEPLLLHDEANGGDPYEAAYALRTRWADEFENGIGRVLQDRLRGPCCLPLRCKN
jgi:hypothetical protein